MSNKPEYVLACKRFLRLFGLYYFKSDTKLKRCVTNVWMFFITFLFLLTALQAVYQQLKKEGFSIARDSPGVVTFFVKMGAFYHILYFFINRDVLHELFDYMSELFPYSSNTGLQEINMEKWIKLKFKVLLLWASTLMMAFFVALWPLAVKDRKLAYDVWYPFDTEKSPNYELIFALQTTTECVMLMTYAICDGIFPCCCVIVVGQFQILSHNIVNIVNTALLQSKVSKGLVEKFAKEFNWPAIEKHGLSIATKTKLTPQEIWLLDNLMSSEDFDETLCVLMTKYIEHHQIILEFCDRMENFFSPYMLVKVYVHRLYFCMELLCVLLFAESNLAFMIALFLYALAALWELFQQTYFGQQVQDEGLNLGSRLYELPWFLCPKRFTTLLRITHMRCQRKIIFTTGKLARLDMETFVIFFNKVLSYAAVLRSII